MDYNIILNIILDNIMILYGVNQKKVYYKLNFVKTEFEEEFSLTYNDLFFIKGNKIYFLIVFHHILNEVLKMNCYNDIVLH